MASNKRTILWGFESASNLFPSRRFGFVISRLSSSNAPLFWAVLEGRFFLVSNPKTVAPTNQKILPFLPASTRETKKKKISSLGLLFLGINWIKLVQNCSLSISTLVSVGLSRMIGLQDLDDTRISQCGGITQVLSAEESLEHRGNPVLTKRKIEEDMGMDIDFYFEI